MGGVGKNRRNKKKIREALPHIINPFTTRDMSTITGMAIHTCKNLLKQFDEVTSHRDPVNKARQFWRYTENV